VTSSKSVRAARWLTGGDPRKSAISGKRRRFSATPSHPICQAFWPDPAPFSLDHAALCVLRRFAEGRICRGVIEGTCAALGLPIRFVTAPSWKRLIGIPPGKDGAKDRARSEAIRRWPDKAALFARVRDDGRADASLIAIAGLKREGGAHV
jgi:hypothetical protein